VLITEVDNVTVVGDLARHFEQLWVGPTAVIYEDTNLESTTDGRILSTIAGRV